MRLFIAEKPSLAEAIAHGLGSFKKENGFFSIKGSEDRVTWCYGHILEQLSPNDYDDKYKSWSVSLLPIFPDDWKLKVKSSASKQFAVIKKLVKEADEIVNAGDPDREGQLLVDEVLLYLKNRKPVKRILLNALDDKSVASALDSIQDNKKFLGLYNSALARSRADWIIGMNLTRLYTDKFRKAGYNSLKVVSIGRVQTPTLALVVNRENEIKNFKPQDYYVYTADWKHNEGILHSKWIPDDSLLDENGYLTNKEVVDSVKSKIENGGIQAVIDTVTVKKINEPAPLPFSLSSLQIAAGKKFGYSPQLILDTMQSLYEKKFTTYPRSDCDYLPESQFSDSKVILANLESVDSLKEMVQHADSTILGKCWNSSKVSAHHAIIPTTVKCNVDSLTEAERNLYVMVAHVYALQFFPTHKYRQIKADLLCMDEKFVANGRIVDDIGWRKYYKSAEKEDAVSIPAIKKGDRTDYISGEASYKKTSPPSHFSEATLVKAMKEIYKFVKDEDLKDSLKDCSGIGTEATRASIIENLKARGFIKIEKKFIIPEKSAYEIINVLPEELKLPDTTAQWEKVLADISDGVSDIKTFIDGQKKLVVSLINSADKISVKASEDTVVCSKCGSAMVRRKGANGFFWGCSAYPNCKNVMADEKGKPVIPEKRATSKCPRCTMTMYRYQDKKNAKQYFWMCSCKSCKLVLTDLKSKPFVAKCPSCNIGFLVKRSGSKGYFWGCDGYPNCNFTAQDENGVPKL